MQADCAVKPDGQNLVLSFVITKWLLFRPLVKGNEDSGNENGCREAHLRLQQGTSRNKGAAIKVSCFYLRNRAAQINRLYDMSFFLASFHISCQRSKACRSCTFCCCRPSSRSGVDDFEFMFGFFGKTVRLCTIQNLRKWFAIGGACQGVVQRKLSPENYHYSIVACKSADEFTYLSHFTSQVTSLFGKSSRGIFMSMILSVNSGRNALLLFLR